MSTREIQGHLEEIYQVEVSPTLISNVTKAVMEEVKIWQSGPLDSVYLIVYVDALVALPFYTGSTAVAQQHDHEMKVGKNGEITLTKETKVGDITLKPGRYQFQHRVEGADHFVHFTEMTKSNPAYPSQPTAGQPKAYPGEVKMRARNPWHEGIPTAGFPEYGGRKRNESSGWKGPGRTSPTYSKRGPSQLAGAPPGLRLSIKKHSVTIMESAFRLGGGP